MKKMLLFVLIVTAALQICVPSYMIWDKYDTLRNGEEVRIRVEPFDPYDAFRGRYVSLNYDYEVDYSERKDKRYGVLEIGEDGFATVREVVKEKPADKLYITSEKENYFVMPLDRYYMEETMAPEAESMIRGQRDAYVTIRIKDDKAVLSGLYIEDKPIEEVIKEEKQP